MRDPAGYAACLRLLRHDAVTHELVIHSHRTAVRATLERRGGVTLVVHDTVKRPARVARVRASVAAVTLKQPRARRGVYRDEPIPVNAIRV